MKKHTDNSNANSETACVQKEEKEQISKDCFSIADPCTNKSCHAYASQLIVQLKRAGQAYKDGYTCSQAVFLAYAQEMGIDENTACRMMEGFGAGIGGSQGICGVLIAATAIISYFSSDGLVGKENQRMELYEKTKEALTVFEREYGGITCKKMLRGCSPEDFPCGMKVKDTVLIINRILESRR